MALFLICVLIDMLRRKFFEPIVFVRRTKSS